MKETWHMQWLKGIRLQRHHLPSDRQVEELCKLIHWYILLVLFFVGISNERKRKRQRKSLVRFSLFTSSPFDSKPSSLHVSLLYVSFWVLCLLLFLLLLSPAVRIHRLLIFLVSENLEGERRTRLNAWYDMDGMDPYHLHRNSQREHPSMSLTSFSSPSWSSLYFLVSKFCVSSQKPSEDKRRSGLWIKQTKRRRLWWHDPLSVGINSM